ncbi:DUF2634 domain-containing protein [Acidaminococcus intestini]|jgi:hypothetical protein|uniref:DUF2634 domain-containing protein n=1 Tax=Acidaminococcus intestini TaxID=187327 RepID=UPI00204E1B12|nr:DUF2634 domain-containing protein [Acidaminococcus intestini]DAP59492.1 MAG TPA: Protein of unknown function (DUF2634) [Caudoviricetes sp.]
MSLLPVDPARAVGSVTIATTETYPNKTYRMLIDDERINGTVTDNLEAVEQAIYKILNTERYQYVIYSWSYGVELADLFGKPIPFVLPEIPRRIKEALTQDDRITDVTNFDLSYDQGGSVLAKFTVVTIYGNLQEQKEVKVANV